MSKDLFKIRLNRVMAQVRFRPTMKSFNNVPVIASVLEDKFDEWVAPKSSKVILNSPSSKKLMQLNSDTITYINEDENFFIDKLDDLVKEIKELMGISFDQFVDGSSIKEVRHVGFRVTQVLESKFKFEDLRDLIFKKFYPQSSKISEISGKDIVDVNYILDSEKNGLLNHTQIGPVRKNEVIKFFYKDFFNVDLSKFDGDGNLFVDIDVFIKNDLDQKTSLEDLNNVIDENLKILYSYLEYINS